MSTKAMELPCRLKTSQRGSETLDGAVDILGLKMRNIYDFNSKVFELVVVTKDNTHVSGEWMEYWSTGSTVEHSIPSYLAMEIIFPFGFRMWLHHAA
jgi:hypothetical protein